jgi:hypothetical protein
VGADGGGEIEFQVASTSIISGGADAPSRDRDATNGAPVVTLSWSGPARLQAHAIAEEAGLHYVKDRCLRSRTPAAGPGPVKTATTGRPLRSGGRGGGRRSGCSGRRGGRGRGLRSGGGRCSGRLRASRTRRRGGIWRRGRGPARGCAGREARGGATAGPGGRAVTLPLEPAPGSLVVGPTLPAPGPVVSGPATPRGAMALKGGATRSVPVSSSHPGPQRSPWLTTTNAP